MTCLRNASGPTLVLLMCACAISAAAVPKHPNRIAYDSLSWHVPAGAPYRHVLDDSLVAYVATDRSLPLVTVVGHVRYATICEPSGKQGVGTLMCQLLRSGGTARLAPDSIDAMLDLFAISLSISLSDTRLEFTCSFLSQFTDTAFYLLREVLFAPRFDEKRLSKERDVLLQQIRHRFDNPGPTLGVAYSKAMYAGSPVSSLATESTVGSLTRKDLAQLHASIFRRANMILGVSGSIDEQDALKRIASLVPRDSAAAPRQQFPAVAPRSDLRALVVHKPISQAYVRMSLPMFQRPHPDYYPCALLNYVLGGGSFSSRLNASVRSDAGLTYSIYSDVVSNYNYPGTFYLQFHTKTESTMEAVRLSLLEIERIRKDGVTAVELAAAKATLIDGLPSMFRGKSDIVEHYTWNEYYGRALDHFITYPDSVRAVSAEQVLAMARKYLQPDSLVYTIVADTTALFAADTSSTRPLRALKPLRVITPEILSEMP